MNLLLEGKQLKGLVARGKMWTSKWKSTIWKLESTTVGGDNFLILKDFLDEIGGDINK